MKRFAPGDFSIIPAVVFFQKADYSATSPPYCHSFNIRERRRLPGPKATHELPVHLTGNRTKQTKRGQENG